MSALFKVESSDITLLNYLQLTKLLKVLLCSEAKSSGIVERGVDVALNINVFDGGEDGRIEWEGGPSETEYLPLRLVQFQNKAVKSMGPSDCAKEVLASDGSIKKMVDEVLQNGGAYILFTTQELNKTQKDERVKVIREEFKSRDKEYAETAVIKIYDASKIESWTNHYLSAIVTVLNFIGRPIERGLKTWDDWSQNLEYQKFPFVADEDRKRAIDGLQKLLETPKNCARIIGLSGMGKTRLAFEAFRGTPETLSLSERVVYADAKSISTLQGLLSDWIRFGIEGIVVVDNCPLVLHDSLRREVRRIDSKLSLLTMDYSVDKAAETYMIQLKQLPNNEIKELLKPVYGERISDLDRIVKFAQGFPQMAVLLADAHLNNEPEMGRLTDDEMAKKLLWRGQEESKEDEEILRCCSLFDFFGMADDASIEYEFIADEVANINVDSFYNCIKRFEEIGIIDRRGRFASIVPKPLAIRLAADWWKRTRPAKQLKFIQSEMPGHLIDSLCEQISLLDFLPEVKDLTEEMCGHQAPFGQAEVILSEKGSRLFRALVEVNPISTSKALLRTLSNLSDIELSKIEGDVRRNLVWALERLCFHEVCFEDSTNSLLLLAANESESWSNNATGTFKQLFRAFLSGTEAQPSIRLNFIDGVLNKGTSAMKNLAVEALKEAIDTTGGSRVVGAEYQGSGKPLKEWHPKVWGEVFDYWEKSLYRLSDLITNKTSLKSKAKDSIGINIRGLMSSGRVEALDSVIKKIVESDGPFWPSALESIKDSLQYDGGGMPDEGKLKLQEWIELLTPSDLEDRLRLMVSIPSFEHKKDESGKYIDIAALNAKKLAEDIAPQIDTLIPFVNNLLIGEQRQAYIFGKYLVESYKNSEPLFTEVVNKIGQIDNPNPTFLFGILNGIYSLGELEWQEKVKLFFERTELNKYYPRAIVTGYTSFEQLDCLKILVIEKKIEAALASSLSYGKALDHLSTDDMTKFAEEFGSISDSSAWVSLDILSMYCHGDLDKWNNCTPTFKKIIPIIKLDEGRVKQTQLEMHHWKSVVEKLLKAEDHDFAVKLAKQIIDSCLNNISYGDIWHYVQPIIRLLFKNHAEHVWPLFSEPIKKAEPREHFRIMHLLDSGGSFKKRSPSVLSDLPDHLLQEWCFENPEVAPEFVARTTEVLINENENYIISSKAKFLIDNFGTNQRVLSALSSNLSSFGWSGSLVPYLEKEIKALETIKDHTIDEVRGWVRDRVDYLVRMKKRESLQDEERDWGLF